MATPATYNFVAVSGDTLTATLTLRYTSSGLPVDLTGATVRMQVRTAYDAATAALDFEVGSGITIDDPTTGVISLSKIVDLSAADYVYDLKVTFPGPVIQTYMRGRLKVLEGVTENA